MFLNLVLLAVAAWAAVQLRGMWLAARARQAAELQHRMQPAPAPPFSALPSPPPVMPSQYADIAQKDLLDRSRNPDVPVDPGPPPPPPKPMPPLPVYHGMMNLGDGPTAILSLTANTPNEPIRPGEKIGEFTLVSVSREGIDLEWDGKTVHRSLDEITVKPAESEGPVQDTRAAMAASAPPPPPVAKAPTGPGQEARGVRECNPNDSMEAGTISDGYRKVVKPGPFGQICYWEPVAGK